MKTKHETIMTTRNLNDGKSNKTRFLYRAKVRGGKPDGLAGKNLPIVRMGTPLLRILDSQPSIVPCPYD
jgi:hypothetical protein